MDDSTNDLIFNTTIDENTINERLSIRGIFSSPILVVGNMVALYFLAACSILNMKYGLLLGIMSYIIVVFISIILYFIDIDKQKIIYSNAYHLAILEENNGNDFLERRYIFLDNCVEVHKNETLIRKIPYSHLKSWNETKTYVIIESKSGAYLAIYKVEAYRKRLKNYLEDKAQWIFSTASKERSK